MVVRRANRRNSDDPVKRLIISVGKCVMSIGDKSYMNTPAAVLLGQADDMPYSSSRKRRMASSSSNYLHEDKAPHRSRLSKDK